METSLALDTPIATTPCKFCDTLPYDGDNGELKGFPVPGPERESYSPVKLVDLRASALSGCRCCETVCNALDLWAPPGFWEPRTGQRQSIWVNASKNRLTLSAYLDYDSLPTLKLFFKDADGPKDTVFGHAKIVPPHSGSEESIAQAKEWLATCLRLHDECKNAGGNFGPSRLLKLTKDGERVSVKLITRDGVKFEYLTLSYCWGEKSFLSTTKENLSENKSGIPWDILPQTLKDAVTLTLKLGYSYIWIDALCILQDDAADWERESGKMAEIYANSVLTLYAASAADANQGFFREKFCPAEDRGKALIDPKFLQRGIGEDMIVTQYRHPLGRNCDICVRQDYHDYIDDFDLALSRSPLDKRAWAYQENVLSTRILHFREAEIMWECNKCTACECGDKAQVFTEDLGWADYYRKCIDEVGFGSSELFVPDAPIEECLSKSCITPFWAKLTFEYSLRSLTYSEDILPALSGIARKMQRLPLGKYLAGLWEAHLPFSLWWTVRDRQGTRETFLKQRARDVKNKYLAPTWSWASGPYALSDSDWGVDKNVSKCRVVDAQCFPAGTDPTGQIEGGYLIIEGSLLHIAFEESPAHIQNRQPLRSYDDEFQVPLEFDNLALKIHAAPMEMIDRTSSRLSDNGHLKLVIHTKDFEVLKGLGGNPGFALLKISETADGSFQALLLKGSNLHQEHYERFGIVSGRDVHIRGGAPAARAYAILTQYFERAHTQAVKLV